jgi:hypothetical protein
MTITIPKGTRLVYQPEHEPSHNKWFERVGKTCVVTHSQRLKRIAIGVSIPVIFEGETDPIMVGVTAVEIVRQS